MLLLLRIIPLVALAVMLVLVPNKRRAYLGAVFLFFPFIDLRVSSVEYGGFTVFDAMTYLSLPFLLDNFRYFRRANSAYTKLAIGLVLALLVGAVTSEFTIDSLLSLLSLASTLVFANIILQELYHSEQALPTLIVALQGLALCSLGWLAVQVITGSNLTFYPELNHNVNDSAGIRYASFFHDPQKYAQFLAVSSFLFLFSSGSDSRVQPVRYALFAACALGLLLTGGRSALFGLGVGFGVLLAVQKVGVQLRVAAVVAIGAFVLYQNADSFIALERLRDIDESYDWRADIWQGAIEIWRTHPVLGIGIGNYQLYAIAHAPYQSILLDNDEIMYLDQPENGYLKVLTEFGLLGFTLFALLIVVPLVKAATFLRVRAARQGLFTLCAALLGWVVAFSSLYSIMDERLLIVVTAVICSIIFTSSTLRHQLHYARL